MGLWIIPTVLVIALAFVLERVARGTDQGSEGATATALPPGDF